MQLIPYLVAFVAGLMLTVQVGLNATLGRAVGNIRFAVLRPWASSGYNFTVASSGILYLCRGVARRAARNGESHCRV